MSHLVATTPQVRGTSTSEGVTRNHRGTTLGADPLDTLVTVAERGCTVHNTLARSVKLTVRRA